MNSQCQFSILSAKQSLKYMMLAFLFVFSSVQVSSLILDSLNADMFQIVSIEMINEIEINESHEEVEGSDLIVHIIDTKIGEELNASNEVSTEVPFNNAFCYLDTPPPEV